MRRMRRTLLLCLAAAWSLALAGPVLAQSDQTQKDQGQMSTATSGSPSTTTSVTGSVVSSSDTELVVDTPTGRQRFVVVAGASDVPANLAAGTQVTVEFRTSGDQRQVSRVTTSISSRTSPGTSPYDSRSSSGTSASGDRDADLPATASPVGLVGLLGLLSLGGSAVLRARRRLL